MPNLYFEDLVPPIRKGYQPDNNTGLRLLGGNSLGGGIGATLRQKPRFCASFDIRKNAEILNPREKKLCKAPGLKNIRLRLKPGKKIRTRKKVT